MTEHQQYIIEERVYDGCGGSYWITAQFPTNPAPDKQTALAYRETHLANRATWTNNQPPLYREDVRIRPESGKTEQSSTEKQAVARGYSYRLKLPKAAPPEVRDKLNALWREKWGNDVFTPSICVSGKYLTGSYTNQPVRDLMAHGYATDADLKAVTDAVWEEERLISELFAWLH